MDAMESEELRKLAHVMVDDSFKIMRDIEAEPPWQPASNEARDYLSQALPSDPKSATQTYSEYTKHILPFRLGNNHPMFGGWYVGGSTMLGALAEFLAAVANPSVAGGNHGAVLLEAQVIRWLRELFGFSESSGGLLVSGASTGNLLAITAARNYALRDHDVRVHGLFGESRHLTAYGSLETHSSIERALEIAGLGRETLRKTPVNEDYSIDCAALERRIRSDLAEELTPFLVIATVGTTNTGAYDDLSQLVRLCQSYGLWLHVDGALGGALAFSRRHQHILKSLSQADSVTFDLHKWLTVPIDAGCLIVRHQRRLRQTFESSPAYLAHHDQGISSGESWFCDEGLELTRRFRALKVWFTIMNQGALQLGEQIDRTIRLAQLLGERVHASAELELLVPVMLNVVCFRYVAHHGTRSLNDLNRRIVEQLQMRGLAVASSTMIGPDYAIRFAVLNPRTAEEHIDALICRVQELGREIAIDLCEDRSA